MFILYSMPEPCLVAKQLQYHSGHVPERLTQRQGYIILSIILCYPVESYRLNSHTDKDNTG